MDPDHPFLQKWKARELKTIDLNQRWNLNLHFPIFTDTNEFEVDVTFKILPKEQTESSAIVQNIEVAQNKWNSKSDFGKSESAQQFGLIHSVRYSGKDDQNRLLISVDTGSSGMEGLKFLLQELDRMGIEIIKVDVENN